ncbi:LOW QUALITY PROTEIN: antigen peptide transporter 2-like [Phaenicophaeus curvirostris]|uniref:LOW QUALITY PROTEIN: antigen peptide transporter 2-like n=1 Tax=Phaenicophaeus curvirostris TaxID=33595 RepID=UPI0037F0B6ED
MDWGSPRVLMGLNWEHWDGLGEPQGVGGSTGMDWGSLKRLSTGVTGVTGAMVLLQASLLLAVDVALLGALAPLAPSLAPWGPLAPWLEALIRLVALGAAARLVAPGGPGGSGVTVAALLAVPPAALLTAWRLAAPPAPPLLATAPSSAIALGHLGATAARLLGARGLRGAGTPAAEGTAAAAPASGTRRLLALAASEWPVLSGAVLCLVAAAIGEAACPLLTGRVLDAVRLGDAATAGPLGLLLAASLASSFFAGCRGGLFCLTKSRLELNLRSSLFSHLVRQDLTFFQETPTAEVSARLGGEVEVLSEAVAMNANVALRSLLLALSVGASMVGLSPALAALALLEVPLAIVARKVYDTRRQRLERALLDATAATTAVVQEAISSIETVRTLAGEEEEERRHARAVAEMLRLKNQLAVERALFIFVHRVLQLAVQVLVLHHGHRQLREGSITPGNVVTFFLYRNKVSSHVQALVYGHGELMNKVAAGRKVWEYLDREPRGDAGGTWAPPTLRGHVVFQGVSFAYPTRPHHLVLKDVSFELRPGEVTALAGPNGSGKSSCAALLQRFYEPSAGRLLLDGVPVGLYQHHYLHRHVAVVGQEPVLFSGTIRDNITLGLEGCSDEEVRAAAATAGALDFITALEKGFDTEVGEKGAQLSAGEKQRVAIARALVRRPRVLVLDEATSALNSDSRDLLERLRGPHAVLLITHCPRLLEAADRAVVLDAGAVVETGTPAELRSRGGTYSRLLRRPSRRPGDTASGSRGHNGGHRGPPGKGSGQQ